MMSNVEQAVKDADALLVIVDAIDKPHEALQFLEMDREWKGPPIGLVGTNLRLEFLSTLRRLGLEGLL